MENNTNISDLISKYILGTIDSSEQIQLNEWLDNPYNKLQFDKITNAETLLENLDDCNYFQSKQNWNKANKKIFEKKSKWLEYAAAILLLPIGVAVAVFLSSVKYQDNNRLSVNTVSSDSIVLLTTHDGISHEISNNDSALVLKGIDINNTKKEIKYNTGALNSVKRLCYNTLSIPKGQKFNLVLSDGTKVHLNSQSTFTYPINFIGDKREVTIIEGEVFFDVSHNKNKPFIVHVNNNHIKVLGTRFNVKSYNNEESDYITLVEGSVKIKNQNNEIKLSPNQQASISNSSKDIIIKNVSTEIFTGWMSDRFIHKNETLNTIMTDLQRYYDIKVFYQSQDIPQMRFSININQKKNLHDILKVMGSNNKLTFIVTSENAVIVKKK